MILLMAKLATSGDLHEEICIASRCFRDRAGMSATNSDEEAYRAVCEAHNCGPSSPLSRFKDLLTTFVVPSLAAKLMQVRHPGSLQTLPRPLEKPLSAPNKYLRNSGELTSGRYGWPHDPFDEQNCVLGEFGSEPYLSLKAGDCAVDFSLIDENGAACRLGDLLITRPVVLTFGMITCPAYQLSKTAEAELVTRLHPHFHFVHVYTLEPHPKGSPAPDIGKPWELMYSHYPQAYTIEERDKLREKILNDHPECQRILLDDLDTDTLVNPVWSTYGPAPRPGFLIRRDGIIDTSQLWFNAAHLEAAARRLLREMQKS